MKIVLQGSLFLFLFLSSDATSQVSPHSNLYLRSPCLGVLSLPPVLDDVVEQKTKQRGHAGMVQKLLGV